MRLPLVALLVVGSVASTSCRPWRMSEPDYPVPAPSGAIPPNLSRVCVIRGESFDDKTPFPTWDNGALVGATRGGTYFCYLAEPGIHELTMGNENRATIAGILEPGKGYFLQHETLPGGGITNVRPVWLADATANALMSQGEYQILTDVPSGFSLPPRSFVVPARAGTAPAQAAGAQTSTPYVTPPAQ